jgi:hypothetical protein
VNKVDGSKWTPLIAGKIFNDKNMIQRTLSHNHVKMAPKYFAN